MKRRRSSRSLVMRAASAILVAVSVVGGAEAAVHRKAAPAARGGADSAATFLERCKASAAIDKSRARAERDRADAVYCIATIKTAAVAIQTIHDYYRERGKPAPRRRGKPPADPASALGGDTCIPPQTTVHAIYVDTQRYAATHPETRSQTPLALMQRAMAAAHPCAKPAAAETPLKRRPVRRAKGKR